ncbi:Bestrophin homolog 24 [Caenorhabditis elegans]|uniref:Bestrophin homolog 24 n=1 Tax=Caenorhabditis elegans TaxID=6239 RepID=BST24_CAEEL|nr:Bestrophin homolog 24 [Caenorhabditis elegans]P34672.1 RecName: Full=Bestrophin homolog 24 [Caenorhabditis elegans]CCD62533.1 Bestrophin homolog 24 [Caenorhabditis elegans]|eukprot:NP_498717.1 Bestrophin homolog 24 [Caenorhabditis elegans]
MTINYNLAVSTSKPWTLFKLLLKWRGSIWKAVILELAVWLVLYGILSVIYRTALNPGQQRTFERIVQYCDSRLSYIPLNFMLGFFVTAVVNRWTYLYQIIGFIDNIGLMAAEYVRGRTEQARMYRRNIVRYCELAQVLVFRDISMRTRRRFPTLDTVVAAGFMMPHEKDRFDEIQYKYSKYWVPFQWAFSLTYEARKKGLIESDYYQVVVQDEIKKFRTGLAWICNYDWVPIPIMYPQLVCLAVHTYFLVCLLARQYVVSEHADNKTEIDLYFPIMSTLQFIFYMGWMKVAEAMLNPFGEDDDDFECNALIDRNITMVLMMVDQGYDRAPDLKRDDFWDEEVEPLYSEETAKIPNNPLKGSVSDVKLPEYVHEIKMVPHCDDASPLVPGDEMRRRRVSVVPVKPSDQQHHHHGHRTRTSLGNIEMFRSFKNKIERSFSKPHLHDDLGRKTFSHGMLENMEFEGSNTNIADGSHANNNSFTNSAFVNSGEDLSNKRIDTSSSQPQLATGKRGSEHPFQHHVLDDVLEDDESDENQLTIRKKSSVLQPAITLVERFNEATGQLETEVKRDEKKKKEEELREEGDNGKEEKDNKEDKKEEQDRPSRPTRPFFIGVVRSESEDHSHPHLRPPTKFE